MICLQTNVGLDSKLLLKYISREHHKEKQRRRGNRYKGGNRLDAVNWVGPAVLRIQHAWVPYRIYHFKSNQRSLQRVKPRSEAMCNPYATRERERERERGREREREMIDCWTSQHHFSVSHEKVYWYKGNNCCFTDCVKQNNPNPLMMTCIRTLKNQFGSTFVWDAIKLYILIVV